LRIHAVIEAIVAEAAAIHPRIRFIAGGFHLVAAEDSVIEKVEASLHDTYKPLPTCSRLSQGHELIVHTTLCTQPKSWFDISPPPVRGPAAYETSAT
jgi:hypothetical protein